MNYKDSYRFEFLLLKPEKNTFASPKENDWAMKYWNERIAKVAKLLRLGLPVTGSVALAADCGRFGFADFQFLSSRKEARTERYPPKTTVAELAG